MLIVNLAIDLWRRRVPLQMCWLWCVMQFYVLGVGRKGRTITDQWDLFVLTFWRLGIFPYTSIPPPCQHLLFTPYSMPGSVLGTEKCLSKSKAPMGDNERMISKKKSFRRFPNHCSFRASVVCCWLDPNPLFLLFQLCGLPRPLCTLEVSSQMWPWATLLFIYIVLTRERGTWGFYNFFFPFSFFD